MASRDGITVAVLAAETSMPLFGLDSTFLLKLDLEL
jgi:hypothetical protein